ncbi:MAG: permease-like cell division protein FtsX [Tenericutes bacterium]|nr:permease-like cell division protein FtsX [Mycoplasmatota bacterium]MDO4341545.1 permease-like cell division protein FtsX [bacterium]
MKIFRIIGRSISGAAKSIARNFSLSMASITCTVITLILVSLGLLVSYNVNNITKDIEKELTIVVFMQKDITEEELKTTEEKLKKIDNVEKVTFTSKETIKNDMMSEYPSFSKMMDSWKENDNPFQDSYIIKVKDVRDINETVTTIKNLDKIDLVKYSESTIGELIKIFDAIKTGTIILVVGLILVTAFLINNTIKITIFSRRNEIDIMRLVGTSNTVIKLPFLFEGLFIGVLGSIIPILITIFGYNYAYDALSSLGTSNLLSVIKLVNPDAIVYKASLIILIIGAVVGMFGSVKAVRKYLTV